MSLLWSLPLSALSLGQPDIQPHYKLIICILLDSKKALGFYFISFLLSFISSKAILISDCRGKKAEQVCEGL